MITNKVLKETMTDWRKDQYINIPAKEYKKPPTKKSIFKMQEDNKL